MREQFQDPNQTSLDLQPKKRTDKELVASILRKRQTGEEYDKEESALIRKQQAEDREDVTNLYRRNIN